MTLAPGTPPPAQNLKPTSPLEFRQLERLVRFLPVIVYTWQANRAPKTRFLSEHTQTLFGFPEHYFYEHPDFWPSRVHPQDRDLIRRKIQEASRVGHAAYTYRFKHADGRYRHFRAQIVSSSAPQNRSTDRSTDPIQGRYTQTPDLVGIEQDVTAQVEHQAALHQERDLLEAVLRISSIAVIVIDPDGRITLANDVAVHQLGLLPPQNGDAAYHRPNWPVTDWAGQPVPQEQWPFQVVLRTQQAIRDHPLAITPPDEPRRLLVINGEPIFDPTGRVQHVVLAINDVTERQEAFNQLAQSESRYRRLVESQLDLVCRYDPDGRITFANAAFHRLFNTTPAAAIGQRFDRFALSGRARKQPITDLVPPGGSWVQEQAVTDGHDRTRCIQWVHRAIADGPAGQPEFLAVGRDITDHRNAERQVQRMKDRLSLIVESCPAIFFTAEPGPPFGLTSISGRHMDLTGYHPSEFITPTDRWQQLVHPEDLPGQLDDLQKAGETGGGRLEFRLLTKEGKYRWLQKDFVVIYDEDGNPAEVVGFTVDIDAQKNSEQSLRESREHYRQMARNNQRLLSEVNHRVRNNLSSLLGLLRITEQNTSRSSQLADRLRTRLHAMARLHNLLASMHWEDLDLHQMLCELLSVPELLHRRATVCTQQGPKVALPPRVVQPLAMTLTEMLINAAKHGAGGVPDGRITVGWQLAGEGQDRQLILHWQESGGPKVHAPGVPSMGTGLIQGFVGYELGGRCELTYPPEGARHTLTVPLPEGETDGAML